MGNPRFETPATDPALRPHPAPERSLVEQLGETADELRQLYTDVGLRPYRVFSVRLKWSGGLVGRGEPRVVREEELLPTPRITTRPLRGEPKSAGVAERGQTVLDQVSPRYTEDELRQLCHCGVALPVDEQGFLEVRVDERDGTTQRRRFQVTGAPFRNAEGFQWEVSLVRQDEPRERTGALPSP